MAVSGFLDTSVVVRYFMNDDPTMAEQATRIIESDADLLLTDGILAEIAFVLTKNYNVSRPMVVDELIKLVERGNVRLYGLDKGVVVQALQLCRPSGRVSFADAMLWASAHSAGVRTVYSFDERFPNRGIALLRATPQEEQASDDD